MASGVVSSGSCSSLDLLGGSHSCTQLADTMQVSGLKISPQDPPSLTERTAGIGQKQIGQGRSFNPAYGCPRFTLDMEASDSDSDGEKSAKVGKTELWNKPRAATTFAPPSVPSHRGSLHLSHSCQQFAQEMTAQDFQALNARNEQAIQEARAAIPSQSDIDPQRGALLQERAEWIALTDLLNLCQKPDIKSILQERLKALESNLSAVRTLKVSFMEHLKMRGLEKEVSQAKKELSKWIEEIPDVVTTWEEMQREWATIDGQMDALTKEIQSPVLSDKKKIELFTILDNLLKKVRGLALQSTGNASEGLSQASLLREIQEGFQIDLCELEGQLRSRCIQESFAF